MSGPFVDIVIAVVVALVMSKGLKVVTRDGDIWTTLARIALCYVGPCAAATCWPVRSPVWALMSWVPCSVPWGCISS